MKRHTGVLSVSAAALLVAAIGGCDRHADASVPDKQRKAETSDVVLAMARGEVDIEGGVIHIVAPSDGRLVDVRAMEGQIVAAGETLALFDSRAAALGLASAHAQLDGAHAHTRLLQLKRHFAMRQGERVQQASDEHAASPQALDEAREILATLDAEVANSASAEEAALAGVHAAQLSLDTLTIRAPVGGRIVAQYAAGHPSEFVHQGAELLLLVPDAPLIVRALIDEDFTNLIHVGMPAAVATDSDPEHPHAAQVLRLGGILRRHDTDTSPDAKHDVQTMDCILSVRASDLLVGQRVLVRFLRGNELSSQNRDPELTR
ncbi:MAG: HlyD family efflux transporter periplasmic adaptor subunit [Gammaproteobacteria bacterium]